MLDVLLPALVDGGQGYVDSLESDTELLDALAAIDWRHVRSSFELSRAVSDDWTLADPVWPDGIEVGPARADELPALHALVYDDAAWEEVDGHVRREFDEWRSVFVTLDLAAQVIARRDGRPVGAAFTRTFSDGMGYVGQLAVATSERGRGLGRALLLAGLRNRRNAGATMLGLGVMAANERALTLYRSVGLQIDREFRLFEPAGPQQDAPGPR